MNLLANSNRASSWQEIVQAHVESLRFGVVQIVVHNSRVVQIERTEKVRLGSAEPSLLAEELTPSRPLVVNKKQTQTVELTERSEAS